MKFQNTIWIGFAFGLMTGAVVLVQAFVRMPSLVYIGYFLMPFAVGFTFLKVSRRGKLVISRFIAGFVTYGLVVSVLEVLAYKPWHTLLTPYGSKYTEYGLSAFYPFPGLILLVIAAVLSIVIWSYAGRYVTKHPLVGAAKAGKKP